MISAIEQGAIARIAAASQSGVLGYEFREVTSYGGQFDEDINEVIQNFPGFWVTFSREGEPQRVGTDIYRHEPVFAALVGAKNFRNEAASRHGASGEPGSYQLLKDARALLVGQILAPDTGAIVPGRTFTLFNRQTHRLKVSVLGFEFTSAYQDGPAQPDISALDDFATFHVDWDLPPHAGFTAVPLDAADADATDDTQLETD